MDVGDLRSRACVLFLQWNVAEEVSNSAELTLITCSRTDHRAFQGQTAWQKDALLQGIVLTQGLNLCFLHWQAGSLRLSHWRSPKRAVRKA